MAKYPTVYHPRQMENTSMALWLHSDAATGLESMDLPQQPASFLESGMKMQQHASEVME